MKRIFLILCSIILVIGINCNLKNSEKGILSNRDIKQIIQQITEREESKIDTFLSKSNEIKLYRYTVLLNKQKSKTIDFSKIIQNSQIIQLTDNKQECDVFVTSISILSENKVMVTITTNTVVKFYFHKKGGKWELYKIITRIIMEPAIIKIKKKGKWYILFPDGNEVLEEKIKK